MNRDLEQAIVLGMFSLMLFVIGILRGQAYDVMAGNNLLILGTVVVAFVGTTTYACRCYMKYTKAKEQMKV